MNRAVGRLIFHLAILATLNVLADEEVKTCVKDGCLIGLTETSRLGRPYRSFLGVPFAKPPINSLRFKLCLPYAVGNLEKITFSNGGDIIVELSKIYDLSFAQFNFLAHDILDQRYNRYLCQKPPEKPDPWDTLEAKEDGKNCPQALLYNKLELDPEASEDCLYLNVYTPQIPGVVKFEKALPVIVIFHPGGFQYWSGTRDHFPGGNLLDRDVVVVSPNYRLNIFGFLSTEDEVSPGNYGLKDQRLALQWVQENIAVFGGDPNSVTIQGQDAGAASVHFHMLSPSSKGLFHRAIAQSGNALAPWSLALPGEAKEHAEYLGKYLECPKDNSSILVECLRWKSVEELLTADPIFFVWQIDPLIPWKPVVEVEHEGAFLTGKPSELLEGGKFHDVPFLTGVTSHEGLFRTSAILLEKHVTTNWNALAIKSYTSALNLYHLELEELKETITKVREFYFGKETITAKDKKQFINLFSDRYFYHPMARSVRLELPHRKNPTFVYQFGYQTPGITFARFFSFVPEDKTKYKGTCHCDDLIHLFPVEKTIFEGADKNDEANAMTDRILDLWINFVLHGNPTPEGYDVTWNPVKSEGIEYLVIKGPNKLEMASEFYGERLIFWEDLNLDRDFPEDAAFLVHDEL